MVRGPAPARSRRSCEGSGGVSASPGAGVGAAILEAPRPRGCGFWSTGSADTPRACSQPGGEEVTAQTPGGSSGHCPRPRNQGL